MLNGKKIIVVLPAYNAAKTLRQTVQEIARDVVDDIILVDDKSVDDTVRLGHELNLFVVQHATNKGYGGNQKTCYSLALERHADVVVMLHPDYQYTPKLVTAMAAMVVSEEFDVVLGSRILGVGAIKGGMPLYKYVANRILTFVQNILIGYTLSEYHTGYRAFSRTVLTSLPLGANSDDFIFDNEILSQAIFFGFRIGEISCPTRYFPDASSINLKRSIIYGLGVLATAIKFRIQKMGIGHFRIFSHDIEAGTMETKERVIP